MARWLIALVAAGCHHAAGPDLVGRWTGGATITKHTAGELALTKAADGWTASIANVHAKLVETEGWLRADLGDGEVRFREATREAYWLQGGGEIEDQAFAQPLALSDKLTAIVVPLPDDLRMTLFVNPDGSAFIREPVHNFGRFVGALTIAHEGNTYTFSDHDKKVWLRATRDGETLHVAMEGSPAKLDLQRTALPAPVPWQPRVPAAGDGWETAALADVGMKPAPIAEWIDSIRTAVPASPHSPAIQALLITRHGKLVVDEYFDGFSLGAPHDTRSAGKSWSSTLAGILVDKHVLSLDAPLLPDDPQKSKITLAHVLSMSTGLDCDDGDDKNPGNEDGMQHQKTQKDWHQFTLALPVVQPPATKGLYCSGGINLSGFYIARATHEWIPAVWTKELAVPLGMSSFYLNLQPNEEGYLGGGTFMRPRDFAKLAQVFLDHGAWHGTQIISKEWIANATAAHASLDTKDDYGLGWWRTTLAGHPAFYSSGNGGQLSIAIPDLDVVVTIMAGNYSDHQTWKHFIEDDVPRYVLTAIR
ncbi:MAG TPA: serine hydrolase domain-containing protein [Kofleriaceae bacterium]